MNDILTFTKNVTKKSGIDLVTYVINYIDQNVIAFGLINQLEQNISDFIIEDDTISIKYNISSIEDEKINNIHNFISSNSIMTIGDVSYNVSSILNDTDFVIFIIKAA